MSSVRRSARLVARARPGGGIRFVARLEPTDGLEYARATAAVASRIEASLDGSVIASRARGRAHPPRSGSGVRLEPWRPARRRFAALASTFGGSSEVIATADVRDCYASIADERLADRLLGLGAHPSEIGRVLRLLDRLHEDGIRGLPVGPDASAILANAVLSVMDRALAVRGVRHLRWIDDVVVFARGEREIERALRGLGEALHEVGLELAPEKTTIRTAGPGMAEALRRMRISQVGALL